MAALRAVLFEVPLMVLLGTVKSLRRLDVRGDRAAELA
jgi:hypothetical protein